MRMRPRTEYAAWAIGGAAITATLLLAVRFLHRDPSQQLAAKATRADLVARLQLQLASAAEAEKSAVLAITDEDSERYADQARAATMQLERGRRELEKMLAAGDVPRERDLLARFSAAFQDLRRIDDEVLRLAVKNTNLKAYALLYGPAADHVADVERALARVPDKRLDAPDARRAIVLAYEARLGLQAYVSVKLPADVVLDAGKFVTNAGAEVIEAKDNWLYSRSLLFGFAVPFTHTVCARRCRSRVRRGSR
jgi:hypothetical protein